MPLGQHLRHILRTLGQDNPPQEGRFRHILRTNDFVRYVGGTLVLGSLLAGVGYVSCGNTSDRTQIRSSSSYVDVGDLNNRNLENYLNQSIKEAVSKFDFSRNPAIILVLGDNPRNAYIFEYDKETNELTRGSKINPELDLNYERLF